MTDDKLSVNFEIKKQLSFLLNWRLTVSGLIEVKISSILDIKKIIGEREVVMNIPSGSTVDQLLSMMISRWGDDLADSIFEKSSRQIKPNVRLIINGRGIGLLDKLDTVLHNGDYFLILPPVGGG